MLKIEDLKPGDMFVYLGQKTNTRVPFNDVIYVSTIISIEEKLIKFYSVKDSTYRTAIVDDDVLSHCAPRKLFQNIDKRVCYVNKDSRSLYYFHDMFVDKAALASHFTEKDVIHILENAYDGRVIRHNDSQYPIQFIN